MSTRPVKAFEQGKFYVHKGITYECLRVIPNSYNAKSSSISIRVSLV